MRIITDDDNDDNGELSVAIESHVDFVQKKINKTADTTIYLFGSFAAGLCVRKARIF